MINANTVVTFMIVVLGLFLVPGPAVLLTLARATSGGRRVGIATGFGIAAGDIVHATMATLGLSAVLMTSALAFNVVKYAGVVYLVYLGIRAFFEKAEALNLPKTRHMDVPRAFRQAVLTEMLNPKTALFFLAFLPQFVHPENGAAIAQFAWLGLIFVAMSAAYTSLIAVGAGALTPWLSRHRNVGRWQGKIVGTIYLSLSVRLALQER